MELRADVIFVTPDIVGPVKNGGIGTACLHYARSLAAAGISVEVLFTADVDRAAKRRWTAWYQDFGIGLLTMNDVPKLPKYTYGAFWYTETSLRLLNFLRDRGQKYVIFQDWHANGFWSARAKEMGVAFADATIGVITHSPNQWQREGMEHYGDEPFERADLEWAEHEALAAADVLISPSLHMINWLQNHDYRLPDTVVHCPITFEDPLQDVEPGTLDADHFIFFGRLETRKGLHLLGSALRMLRAGGDSLPRRISLLGKHALVEEKPSQEYLAQLQADLPEISFQVETELSYAEAVSYIKRANGLVVIASLLDNFPLTVVESITNGFCFIAAAVGGIPEIADSAITFEPTAEALRNKLLARRHINWELLRHPYDPERARTTWLNHVRGVLADPAGSTSNFASTPPAVIGRASAPVSVCVPFYRHDPYLRRMVTAFLQESEPAVQLVIVNDGTPAEDASEFHALADLLGPLGHVFYTQENAGVGAARNAAVRLAKHDLIVFFDSDNVPFPHMVSRLCGAMRSSKADCVAVPFAAVPLMDRMPVEDDVWFHFIPPGGSAARSLVDNVLADAGCLIKREVFDALGGFTEERHSWEDWEFFLRLALQGFKLRVYPEPISFYAHCPNGRNESARRYHNRMSLLGSLRDAPRDQLVAMLSVFARDHLKRENRL